MDDYIIPCLRHYVKYEMIIEQSINMTDKGLMASADITGTKYWKNDDLNEKEQKES